MRKDSKWFDFNNPTEMSAKITKEVSCIQNGIGEKVGMLI